MFACLSCMSYICDSFGVKPRFGLHNRRLTAFRGIWT